MIRVGLVGASGYTGAELARILCNHSQVELTVVTSRQYAGKPLAEVFPHLRGKVDLVCENVVADELMDRADIFFLAVPHKTAMELVPSFIEAGKKVVDLSADFRIHDAAVYEEWYQPHSATQYLDEAIYGLPELYRDKISSARLVANPGCYPTSVILALAPLLRAGVVDPSTLVVDSKSGVSGAGRGANVGSLYCEMGEGFKAYKVGDHRHTPEIEQEISLLAGKAVNISFTPHLLPMSRGILSTIYAKVDGGFAEADIRKLYNDAYQNEAFVRICPEGDFPATQFVRGSNCCDIGFKLDQRTGRVVIVSVIDNLVKGAAGQAVQNMNLLCGFPEGEGLSQAPLFP